MRYAIVIEKAQPTIPLTFRISPAVLLPARPSEVVENEIRAAIEFHIEGMREDGDPIPLPQNKVEYVNVAA